IRFTIHDSNSIRDSREKSGQVVSRFPILTSCGFVLHLTTHLSPRHTSVIKHYGKNDEEASTVVEENFHIMRTLPTGFKQVSDLNEIIFAHRNKLYGAYELRKHYNDRLLKAFVITTSSLLLLLLISFAMQRKPPEIPVNPLPPDPGTLKTFTI